MKYYILEPDVAGGLGENTVMDRSVHPPSVSKLHYEFYGWFGDAIVASFPCFLVTLAAKNALEGGGMIGADFADVEVSTSDEFNGLFPHTDLPPFVWMKVYGQAGRHDLGVGSDGRLIVSQRALDLLANLGTSHALITPLV